MAEINVLIRATSAAVLNGIGNSDVSAIVGSKYTAK
jgi:hypothetical protein